MPHTAQRLSELQAKIAAACDRAHRSVSELQMVAVAKTATPDTLREAWEAGQRLFAHNRVESLEEHRLVLPDAEWHLIGPVQGKKLSRALSCADCIQTVGDLKTAERIARRLEGHEGASQEVLLQINLSPEDGRYGCKAQDLSPMLATALSFPSLRIRGLMTLAPQGASPDELRGHFSTLRQLAEAKVAEGLPKDFELSMGMSEDFEIAVEEGATLVRIGRAIFPPPQL